MIYKDYSKYLLAVTIGHVLLGRKLININEFLLFEIKMCEEYGLPQNSIFRDELVILQRISGDDPRCSGPCSRTPPRNSRHSKTMESLVSTG